MPISMAFLCFCDYGEVQEDGYQYCKHCGKAKAAPIKPCEHDWVDENAHSVNRTGRQAGIIYIQRCSKCKELQKVVVGEDFNTAQKVMT